LFAGETCLVGFCVGWTREELGFISLEDFLLSLGFLDYREVAVGIVARRGAWLSDFIGEMTQSGFTVSKRPLIC